MVPRIWLDRLAPFRRSVRLGRRRPPPLGVQRLEPRLACAGVVTATLRGDELTLVGDDLPNAVEIRSDGLGGIEVGDAFTGTQFRHAGRLLPALNVSNVGRLTIRLAGGALSIATGHGSDGILLNAITSGGDTTLHTGDHADIVSLAGSSEVGGDLVIDKDAGSLHVATDGLTLERVTGRMVIDSGAALTAIELVGIVAGRDLRVTTGRGEDTVRIAESSAGGTLEVTTGAGADVVTLDQVRAGLVRVLAQGDEDVVTLEDMGGGRVEADGGRGDGDRLAILPPVVVQVVSSGFEIMG